MRYRNLRKKATKCTGKCRSGIPLDNNTVWAKRFNHLPQLLNNTRKKP